MPLRAPRSAPSKPASAVHQAKPIEASAAQSAPPFADKPPTRLRGASIPVEAPGLPKEAQALPQHTAMLACFDEALPLLEKTAAKMLEGLAKAYDIANTLERNGDAEGAKAYRRAAEDGLAFAKTLSATFHQTRHAFSA